MRLVDAFTAQVVARHAERPGFRVTELRMTAEQRVPWHRHTSIEDTFYVLEGRIRISLRDPDEQVELGAGESWGPVRAGRPHLVTNAGEEEVIFLDLQGIGDWDFVPLS
jgi:quercetin dioxygenase-like cupin family protein